MLGAVLLFFRSGFVGVFLFVFSLFFCAFFGPFLVLGAVLLFFRSGFLGVFLFVFSLLFGLFLVLFWPWVLGAVLLFFRSGFLGVFLFVFSILFELFLATLENRKKSAAKTHTEICRFPFVEMRPPKPLRKDVVYLLWKCVF